MGIPIIIMMINFMFWIYRNTFALPQTKRVHRYCTFICTLSVLFFIKSSWGPACDLIQIAVGTDFFVQHIFAVEVTLISPVILPGMQGYFLKLLLLLEPFNLDSFWPAKKPLLPQTCFSIVIWAGYIYSCLLYTYLFN